MKNKLPHSRYMRVQAFKKALADYNNEPVTILGSTLKRHVWKELLYGSTFLVLLAGFATNNYINRPMTSPVPTVYAAEQQERISLNPFDYITANIITTGKVESANAPTPTPTLTQEQIHTWDNFKKAAVKVSEMYNFPARVVISQAALESARGTSQYALTRQNYLGIGAYDDNPDLAWTFENQEQCIVEYMRIIRSNFPEAWEERDNPDRLLYLLKHNSKGNYYASDPLYIQKVTSMPEWNQY